MPKIIPIASAIEAHRIASETPFLCLLKLELISQDTGSLVETLYIARNTEPVTFRGQVCDAALFEISLQYEAGKFSEVSLAVNDYTRALQARMEQYGGIIGSRVTLSIVNAGNLASGEAEAEEIFEIVGATSTEYRQEFVLGADNDLARPYPRRRQTKDFCQWRYKGPECGYVGAMTTCDLTLQGPNGCAAHANTNRFGAYPGLNSNGFRYA